jgi:hypothetical protein
VEDKRKEVIIAGRGLAAAKSVSIAQPKRRKPGSLQGKLKAKPGAFKPLNAKELRAWGME